MRKILQTVFAGSVILFSNIASAQKQYIFKTGNDALVFKLHGYSDRFVNVDNRNFSEKQFNIIPAWTYDGQKGETEVYIKLDLPPLEADKIISAKLKLFGATQKGSYIESHSQLSGNNDFYINRVLQNWENTEISWNNKPEISYPDQILVEGTDIENKDFEIDITQQLKLSVTNKTQSFGFNINLKTKEFYRRLVFASFEYPDSAKHPELVISYSGKIDKKYKNDIKQHKETKLESAQKNSHKNKPDNDTYIIVLYDTEGNEIKRIEYKNLDNSDKTDSGTYNFNIIKNKNTKASGKVIIY